MTSMDDVVIPDEGTAMVSPIVLATYPITLALDHMLLAARMIGWQTP
jgi:hypothetical protein